MHTWTKDRMLQGKASIENRVVWNDGPQWGSCVKFSLKTLRPNVRPKAWVNAIPRELQKKIKRKI